MGNTTPDQIMKDMASNTSNDISIYVMQMKDCEIQGIVKPQRSKGVQMASFPFHSDSRFLDLQLVLVQLADVLCLSLYKKCVRLNNHIWFDCLLIIVYLHGTNITTLFYLPVNPLKQAQIPISMMPSMMKRPSHIPMLVCSVEQRSSCNKGGCIFTFLKQSVGCDSIMMCLMTATSRSAMDLKFSLSSFYDSDTKLLAELFYGLTGLQPSSNCGRKE